MQNIYFTSDCHFGHANIIKYCNRPFSSLEEMDEVLIYNWNGRVGKNDIVYYLGDIARKNWEYYLDRLNGKKHLILGSHDKENNYLTRFESVNNLLNIKINGIYVVMCHCPFYTWERKRYGALHLYGHVHGTFKGFGKSMDCGVDTNNFYIYSFDEIVSILNKRDIWYIPELIKQDALEA